MLSICQENQPIDAWSAVLTGGNIIQEVRVDEAQHRYQPQKFTNNIVSKAPRLEILLLAKADGRSCYDSTSSKLFDTSRVLPADYTPGPYDVICSRTKMAWNHSGNIYFRAVVREASDAYARAGTKNERGVIVSQIVEHMRIKGTGFVKEERGRKGVWIEVGDAHAREKTGQLLRNSLSGKYRSSHNAKKQRRRNIVKKGTDGLHDFMQSHTGIASCMARLRDVGFDPSLSDDEMLARLTQTQFNLLENAKIEAGLVERFHQAEISACLVVGGHWFDVDGDTQMGWN